MAYRVFFGVIPENRHSSTAWPTNQDFFRGLFRSERGPAEPVRRPARVGIANSPVRPAGQPMMRLAGTDLACVRGGRQVFRGLSFTLGAGEALLVTGPNGAGKSSLLRLVAGLVRPDAGRLEFEGGDPELTVGEHVHYLGHQDALKSSLSVRENLAFWAHFLGGGPAKGAGGQGRGSPCGRRSRRAGPAARELSLRRAAPPPVACPPDCGRAADLVAR